MLIPASDFTTLPPECPVLWGDTPAVILGRHGATEYRLRVEGRLPTTTAVGASQLRVDLSTPAAVRAFAPALICAVKGLLYPPERPPAAVWSRREGAYVLLEEVTMSGLIVCAPAAANELPITGGTPEEALLNGLKAALDAAGGTP